MGKGQFNFDSDESLTRDDFAVIELDLNDDSDIKGLETRGWGEGIG